MYAHIERSKGKQSLAIATTVNKKKSVGKKGFGFVDGSPLLFRTTQLKKMKDAYESRQLAFKTHIQHIAHWKNRQAGVGKVINDRTLEVSTTNATQSTPETAQVKAERKLTPDTIQRAGHKDDLCFVGRWLVKRADAKEIKQYLSGEVPPNAPMFSGPFYTKEEALGFLQEQGEFISSEKEVKINAMASNVSEGGKGFMMLANVTAGLVAPQMRDLKVGIHTASGTDQVRHGVTGLSKKFKEIRHGLIDRITPSATLGFRDEDSWKESKTADNTAELKKMLDCAHLKVLAGIQYDIKEFIGWLEYTQVVYVGMSLLVVVSEEAGKAVAIDFEHPIFSTDTSFKTHKDGIAKGAKNLLKIVKEIYEKRNFYRLINANEEGNLYIGDYDL